MASEAFLCLGSMVFLLCIFLFGLQHSQLSARVPRFHPGPAAYVLQPDPVAVGLRDPLWHLLGELLRQWRCAPIHPCRIWDPSMSNVVEWRELMASIPTQRWKQVPVSWPRRRCIFPCITRSSLLWAICKKRFTRAPVMGEVADASSGSRAARSYVSATALMEGRIMGWFRGSSTNFPKR